MTDLIFIFARYLAKENKRRNIYQAIPAGELGTYFADFFMTVPK